MDIVERLRIQEETGFVYLPSDWGFVSYGKAADEIERLREEIQLLHIRIDYYMKVLALRDDIQQEDSE